MSPVTQDIQLAPNAWLKEMAKLRPAKWNSRRSIRATTAIVLPMLIGYFTGTLAITMWISMGAMFPSIGERDAPYSFTIRKILISAPIGASGFLMGYLGIWLDQWLAVVLIMSLVSFICAIASSYSATVSIGCLQFLVMAAVSLGNPEIATFWKSSLLLLGGACFYLFLIVLEKWLAPHQIRKDAITSVLQALIDICDKKMAGQPLDEARLNFNIQYQALYTLMLQSRYQALGHNPFIDQTAKIVQNLDNLFAALIANSHPEQLTKLKSYLCSIKQAFFAGDESPSLDTADIAFLAPINDLTLALWGNSGFTAKPSATPKQRFDLAIALQKLTPGRATLFSAAALTLCTFLGYSIRWIDHVSHWYWVPMTVAIVMKPELGSIFVRAVQRTVGTAAGVMVGGIVLALLPVGIPFIAVIALITFVLPWLAQRNYALTAFAITPLVLVLIDFLTPGANPINFAALRLVDTLIGCAIVLFFGYLLWPKRHTNELTDAMNGITHCLAHYLELVLANPHSPAEPYLSEARRNAYGQIVDMRAALQKSMAEPPPAGYEAAAWFPLVACAARLCDAITVYSVSASQEPDPSQWQWLLQIPKCIAGLAPLPPFTLPANSNPTPETLLIASIRKETHTRESLYDRSEPSAVSTASS